MFIAAQMVTLTTTIGGDGAGFVEPGSGFTCYHLNPGTSATTCATSWPQGSVVTLHATPSCTSSFGGWLSPCFTATGDCTVTMKGNQSVTALFFATQNLTATAAGSGTGDVYDSYGHTCFKTSAALTPSSCSWKYGYGTVVTLHAAPSTQAVIPFPIINLAGYVTSLNETNRVITGDATTSGSNVAADVLNWADHNDNLSSHFRFGVVPQAAGALIRGDTLSSAYDATVNLTGNTDRILCGGAQPISEAQENRPLTGFAHEFNHGVGLVHGGQQCGSNSNGQVGEAWPPLSVAPGVTGYVDGLLDGIGLDTSAASPYTIIRSTSASPVYDLMSYCGSTADGSFNANGFVAPPTVDHWISVRKLES
jgi:hypothetical protein